MATGDQNRPSITSTMKDLTKTHFGDVTKKPLSWKVRQKARQIVDTQMWRAVIGTCLNVSKQVFDLFVLLVDSKLKNLVPIYTQPCLYNYKDVEMKANNR